MRARSTVVALALSLSATLLLTGCGRSAEEQEAADNLGLGLIQHTDPTSPLVLGAEFAQCTAGGLVDRVGVDKLVDDGMLTSSLELGEQGQASISREVAEAFGDATYECLDLEAYAKAVTDTDDPAGMADCFDDIGEDLWKTATADMLGANHATAEVQEWTDAMWRCEQL